ncbi:MAG: SusD/RagB family nutrient-binding outer membrane lipoprotein, partial [Muribaculaceae bacterium]|nr:SusD/RagB family nutrient-binding outer membrane lipoprotein [Muribaculaceae bacterium]
MKINIFALALAVAASTFATGCGDRFQEELPWMVGSQDQMDNDDEDGLGAKDITVLEKELRGAIPFMLNYSHEPTGTWAPHKYQYQRSNNVDNYAGYWTTSKGTFTFGGPMPSLYTPDNDYLGGPLDNQLFNNSKNAIYYAEALGKPEWRAVALIIQAYLGHELVDFYGALPFNDWRKMNRVPPLKWEAGADIYAQIFTELDEAIAILKERQPSASELEKIEDPNKTVSDGDWIRWVKFANSIK